MDSLPLIVRNSEDGALLTVHVQPNASQTECVGVHGEALKIRVAARPIQGGANDELIRFIADRCAIQRKYVQIRGGAEGRLKRLYVKGVTAELLLARLLPGDSKGMVER